MRVLAMAQQFWLGSLLAGFLGLFVLAEMPVQAEHAPTPLPLPGVPAQVHLHPTCTPGDLPLPLHSDETLPLGSEKPLLTPPFTWPGIVERKFALLGSMIGTLDSADQISQLRQTVAEQEESIKKLKETLVEMQPDAEKRYPLTSYPGLHWEPEAPVFSWGGFMK